MIGVLLAGFCGIGDQDRQSSMYLPALTDHAGFRIVATCPGDDTDRDVAAKVASRLGVSCLPDLDAGLDEPGVDAVVVAVPPAQRRDAITTALRAGKHVLADKPLAADLADAEAIVDAARREKRVLLPAHHQRWNPAVRSLCGAVASGRVGLPWNVQADLLVAGGNPAPTGELLNFGMYPLDVLRAMLGLDAVRVHALGGRYWPGRAADDFATLLVDYRNGVTATVAVGRTAELHDLSAGGVLRHRYRISGSHGVLAADATRPALAVRTRSQHAGRWTGGSTVDGLIAEFHRAITTGGQPAISLDDVLDVHRILDAADRSLRSGQPSDIVARREVAPQEGGNVR